MTATAAAAAAAASKMTMVKAANGDNIGSGDGGRDGCKHYVGPLQL